MKRGTSVNILRLMDGISSNVKFTKNWWLPILIRLGIIKKGHVVLRTGEVLELSKYNWDSYLIRRNLVVNRKVVTYPLNGGYLAKLNFAILWAPSLKLLEAAANEDLMSIYPREYFSKKVIIDVGAYIGDTAILFSKCYGAKKVIAIEPNPIHYKVLLFNLRLNKVSNVEVMNRALCSEGSKEVCIEGLGHSAKTKEILGNDECNCLINCVGLDEVIRKYEPDTAKIDCEGCEYDVILNTDPEILKKVSTYIIEFHNKYFEERITKYLRELGYVKVRTTQEIKSDDLYAKVIVFKRT